MYAIRSYYVKFVIIIHNFHFAAHNILCLGKIIFTVVPLSFSDSNSSFPLCSFIMLYVIDKPKPVPSPGALVVKKGSVIFLRFSCEIPWPESLMVINTLEVVSSVFMLIIPSDSIACIALLKIFINT